ncbi:MAG: hypothetical protein J7L21_03265, partial [Sulfurimonas sp.]|nr:hypothetical protein [Sulfurimonas sp.]
YITDNEINLSEEDAWLKLLDQKVISIKNHTTLRRFINDEHYGFQSRAGTIEFNSRALDEIFKEYIFRQPTLFN